MRSVWIIRHYAGDYEVIDFVASTEEKATAWLEANSCEVKTITLRTGESFLQYLESPMTAYSCDEYEVDGE